MPGYFHFRWMKPVLLLFPLLLPVMATAVERIEVLALFKDKAMLRIDGTNRLLEAGESSVEGVRLVSADARKAVVEIAGERRTLKPGGQVGAAFQPPETSEVRILRDATGAFLTTGSINGRMVDMMIDTGATVVALGASEARRIGIPYRMEGRPVGVNTASGTATGYLVELDRVQVGEIVLRNVGATVIDGVGPPKVLLGMSFLSQVEMQNQGGVLLLRKKE